MLIKFVKFYRSEDDKGYAVADDGLVFRFSIGAGFGFEHVEKLPDGAKEITAQEWAAAQLPEAIEFHVAGEKDEPREMTPEEKAMDDAWRNGVRAWRQNRAEAVERAIRECTAVGADAFEITETVTKSYNSLVLLAAVGAVIGAGQPPEDPIEWRRGDKIDRMAELIRAVKDAIGPMINLWAMSKAGVPSGRPTGRAAPPQAAPHPPAPPQAAPMPAPAAQPAEPKAEEPTKP